MNVNHDEPPTPGWGQWCFARTRLTTSLFISIPNSILGRPGIRIVIGMLVAFDPRQAIGRKHLVRLSRFVTGAPFLEDRGVRLTSPQGKSIPMPRERLEVADFFRAYGPAWRSANVGHLSLGLHRSPTTSAATGIARSAKGQPLSNGWQSAENVIRQTLGDAQATGRG